MDTLTTHAHAIQIVLLNGASSSGKSQLARALQRILKEPFLRLDIDDFIAMFPDEFQGAGDRANEGIYQLASDPGVRLGPFGQRFLSGFHQAAAAFARAGNQMIVAHLLLNPRWLLQCVEAWNDLRVLSVGVHCDPAQLEVREQQRRDRTAGFSASHYAYVHSAAIYDLTVDTSDHESEACARAIRDRVLDRDPPTAFERMHCARECAW